MAGRSLPCHDYLPKASAAALMQHWLSCAQIVAAVPSGSIGISLIKVARPLRAEGGNFAADMDIVDKVGHVSSVGQSMFSCALPAQGNARKTG
jgi:hypothetical protein